MKGRVSFVERKRSDSVSIERVFKQVARDLPANGIDVSFEAVPFGNGLAAILRNLITFQANEADVYHVTGDVHYITLRLPRDRTILTIHDLIFLHRRRGLRRFLLKKLFLDWPLSRARYITVVSSAVKDEIVKYTWIDPDRITVIDNPLIEGFSPETPRIFNSDRPVILHIGTAENKNLANLIQAVRDIRCTLRIIGRLDDITVETLKRNKIIYENVYGLDEKQMVREYADADILSFCSTYEGFGLPIIEAQAMHRPVMTSNVRPMNDVAGAGAALVDPLNVESIRATLLKLIDDGDYRSSLVEIGAENVNRFDRKFVASRYADLYMRVIKASFGK